MAGFGKAVTPWWYWLIVVIGLAWNAGGGYDYLMTVTQNAAYMSQVPEDAMAYYLSLPSWLVWPWALAVWGGVLGWLLMLARSRFAVPAFLVSLIAMLVNFGYWIPTGGLSAVGTSGAVMTVVVVLGAVFAVWYSRKMRSRGILR